jgi:hypothetical protein
MKNTFTRNVYSLIAVMVLATAACTRRDAVEDSDRSVASAAGNKSPNGFHPPLLMPDASEHISTPAPEPMTPEQQAAADEQFRQLTLKLAKALKEAKGSESWTPPPEIQTALEFAAKDGTVAQTGCAKDFCRYMVTTSGSQARKTFAEVFSVEGSVLFEYPRDNDKQVTAYVFRADADLSWL